MRKNAHLKTSTCKSISRVSRKAAYPIAATLYSQRTRRAISILESNIPEPFKHELLRLYLTKLQIEDKMCSIGGDRYGKTKD